MAEKTHKTAVVILPPRAMWVPIQAIRREYDRQFRRWMPHMTLIYPFRPRNQFEEVSRGFARACSHLRPFEVELANFDSFSHPSGTHTIWLIPSPQGPITELQSLLLEVVPDCDDTSRFVGGFKPHLSVGQVRGKALDPILTRLRTKWKPLRFQVSEIDLIWRRGPPDDVFRSGVKIKLGPDKPSSKEYGSVG